MLRFSMKHIVKLTHTTYVDLLNKKKNKSNKGSGNYKANSDRFTISLQNSITH